MTTLPPAPVGVLQCPAPVRFIESIDAPVWSVYRHAGVLVNTWQAEAICGYAGIKTGCYLGLLAALGRMQWVALAANPLIEPDDFAHPRLGCCLFSRLAHFEEIALLLENPRICDGSRWFYQELVPPEEWRRVEEALRGLHS